MTGRIPPFGRLASALACWLILAACLAVCGCGARSAQRAQGGRLSPEAKQTYDYLVYQDMILRLQRLVRKENPSKQDMDEAYALQKKAAEALDKIIGSEPEPKLYAEKAGLYWNTEQIAEARQALKQGLERFPKDKTLNLYLANSYLVENRLQDAALTLGDYLGRAPDDHLARERLAQILLDTGQDARALDELKLIPGPERSAETLYLMARAQARLGQRRQAIETLKRSLEKDGDLIEAWAELAYQYELEKDYVSAEKTYNKILSLGELQDEVMIRLINLGLKMNNPEKALAVALNGPGTKAFVL
ncbi:MAG: tetratricopeptide repeat protein, partial [Desulfovibrionaceae bacterium]|nr:tetratricopeptide repeat protein [Desulfovibrionaceae bacterium]